MTAREVWRYEAGHTIYSAVCGSTYHTAARSLLIDYATADDMTEALLVGLGPDHRPVFEFEYPTTYCNTSWNARPIPSEDLQIDR